MNVAVRICIALCLTLPWTPASADCNSGTVLVSGKSDYPPISWAQNKQLTGLGYIVTGEILKSLGLKMEITSAKPWKRILNDAEDGEIDILVGIRENSERQNLFDFVPTTLIESSQNSFFMKGTQISTMEDLKGKKGGIIAGSSFSEEFDKFATEFLRLLPVKTLTQNLKKLERNRIDYIISPLLPTIHHIKQNHLKIDISFVASPLFTLDEKIAISKKSSCKKHLAYFNQKLQEMHENDFVYEQFDELTEEWNVLEYLK